MTVSVVVLVFLATPLLTFVDIDYYCIDDFFVVVWMRDWLADSILLFISFCDLKVSTDFLGAKVFLCWYIDLLYAIFLATKLGSSDIASTYLNWRVL